MKRIAGQQQSIRRSPTFGLLSHNCSVIPWSRPALCPLLDGLLEQMTTAGPEIGPREREIHAGQANWENLAESADRVNPESGELPRGRRVWSWTGVHSECIVDVRMCRLRHFIGTQCCAI